MARIREIGVVLSCLIALAVLFPQESTAAFDDNGWVVKYQENFDSSFVGTHGQTFSTDGWLKFQLFNGGVITIANGYATLNAPDFWNAGLIRSSAVLPDEYRIRTKVGYINYDVANYEQADFDNPSFNDHGGFYENGMYFLTVTDDTCAGNQCAELWWHYHRKMVIDVDNHIGNGVGLVQHPVYMVYMDPTTNEGGNRLRTWDGVEWDESPWNWNIAYTYAYDTWYYAELTKKDGYITLRLYDQNQNILEDPPPVAINKVFAMDQPSFFYVGEPHTDDYEGDVRIDEITLLTPDVASGADDPSEDKPLPRVFTVSQNFPNPFNPSTTIEFDLTQRTQVRVGIYNVLGEQVCELMDKELSVGSYRVDWDGRTSDGRPVSSGVYFYRVQTEGHTATKKMLLIK